VRKERWVALGHKDVQVLRDQLDRWDPLVRKVTKVSKVTEDLKDLLVF
jgi:hypothetical protein